MDEIPNIPKIPRVEGPRELSVAEFQVKFAAVVKAIRKGGQFIVTKHGFPAAKIYAPSAAVEPITLSSINKWISSRKARATLGQLVSQAQYGGVRIMITSGGEPAILMEGLKKEL